MNVFSLFEARFHEAALALKEAGVLPASADASALTVEPPRDASHGDIASNAAMILAKQAKTPPRDLATEFAKKMEAYPDVAKVDVAGPGFINLTLKPDFWQTVLGSVLAGGDDYGRSEKGR